MLQFIEVAQAEESFPDAGSDLGLAAGADFQPAEVGVA